MDNELDLNILESKFELQSSLYVHFQTNTLRKCVDPYLPEQLVK